MIDFIKNNRTSILSMGSALAGFVVIALNTFIKTPLTAEQTKAVELACSGICGGLIYLENYLQNREHKGNVTKIDTTQSVVISSAYDIEDNTNKIEAVKE